MPDVAMSRGAKLENWKKHWTLLTRMRGLLTGRTDSCRLRTALALSGSQRNLLLEFSDHSVARARLGART